MRYGRAIDRITGVAELEEMAEQFEIREVPIGEIVPDPETQSRASINDPVVAEYREVLEQLPPCILFRDADGRHWIGDGWHRFLAAREANRETLRADVRPGGKDEAIEHACGANAAHGLRRSRADVRRSIELMLTRLAHKSYSDREIARKVGCSPTTVGEVRSTVQFGQFDDGQRTAVRNGAEYTIRTAAIGKKVEGPAIAPAPAEPGGAEPEPEPADPPKAAEKPRPPGIPENAIVEDPGETTRPREQTDEEWLADLPARKELAGKKQAMFDLDALLWRRISEVRREFITTADKATKAMEKEAKKVGLEVRGWTSGLIRWFKERSHPAAWIICPSCKGTGDWHDTRIQVLTRCGTCAGRGYRPKDGTPGKAGE